MTTNNYLDKIQSNGFLLLKDTDFNIDKRILDKVYELFSRVKRNPESYFNKYRNHLLPENNPISSLEEFNKIIKDHESFKEEPQHGKVWFQLWRYANVPEMFNMYVYSYLRTIIKTIYDKEVSNFDSFNSVLTSFTKGCAIINHRDEPANGKRLCVILSYFSDNWKEEYGGILKIDNNTISMPNLGNIVVLDFTKNNIEHEVSEVLIENKHRLALTTFVEIK
jgi:Rps23 Pro-64 3,4-dihydroxylase Tpa1-like proline 4-hydroxylase